MPYGQVLVDTVKDSLNNVLAPASAVFRNRIINGAMVIDQRNAGASVNNDTTGSQYTLDRWNVYGSQSAKFSIQQNAGSVTPPVGFTKYLGITSLSAYSVGASDVFELLQKIEGFNVADLAWGTANAKTVTLSFQVYSSLTGTFGGAITNGSANRSYPFSYTVSSANTWTSISVTIAGDTTGTWATNNTSGIQVVFSLGAGSTYSGTANTWAGANYTQPTGSVSVVGTNGATFYITGCQLEVGTNATNFDYRPYGTELVLCQRYYFSDGYAQSGSAYGAIGVGINASTTIAAFQYYVPQNMRTVPSLTSTGSFQDLVSGATGSVSGINGSRSTTRSLLLNVTYSSGTGVVNAVCYINANNSTTWQIGLSAEL